MSWATEELRGADLGDERRNRRLIQIVEDLAAQPNASVPQASRDGAALQGIYDFWSNRRIKPESILNAHRQRTIERIQEHSTVLAIQDTTELDYSTHRQTRGLGAISNPAAQGMKVHSVLAASAAGIPLGIVHQMVWSREQRRATSGSKRHKAIAQKESGRWLESLEVVQTLVPEDIWVITVADREADIYELFAHPRRPNSEFLIRAAQNRNTCSEAFSEDIQPLFSAIRSTPSQGTIQLELQRTPRRAARVVTLDVRFTELWLQPPAHLKGVTPLKVWVILAEESTPPEGESPICWFLLTTIAVSNFATAQQCLIWYSFRWLIERYHYTLKSGCRLEALQLKQADRLHRALATYAHP